MPVFGNRVVVATADVKHIKEFKTGINQREEALAQWGSEREKRKQNLEVLQCHIESRRASMVSVSTSSVKSKQEEEHEGPQETEVQTEVPSETEVVKSDEKSAVDDNVNKSDESLKKDVKIVTDRENPKCSQCRLL